MGKHEGCVSFHPPSNSLELFTLFSLPFLHFYNFFGDSGLSGLEGGVRCCQVPARAGCLLRSSVGPRVLCPFFSSSQDSKEGLTDVLPPSPGPLWRKRGESECSSFQGGLQ